MQAGLAALLARDASFGDRPCATSWAVQPGSDWRAFRVDYVGGKLVALRTAMKAALEAAQLPGAHVSTTQPARVTLFRQTPEVPTVFEGTLALLEIALHEAAENGFAA